MTPRWHRSGQRGRGEAIPEVVLHRSLALLALASSAALARPLPPGSATHTVSVEVQPFDDIEVLGGDIVLVLDEAIAGQGPTAATDESASLTWSTNGVLRRIVVETDLPTR